jgi:hypothetical protein
MSPSIRSGVLPILRPVSGFPSRRCSSRSWQARFFSDIRAPSFPNVGFLTDNPAGIAFAANSMPSMKIETESTSSSCAVPVPASGASRRGRCLVGFILLSSARALQIRQSTSRFVSEQLVHVQARYLCGHFVDLGSAPLHRTRGRVVKTSRPECRELAGTQARVDRRRGEDEHVLRHGPWEVAHPLARSRRRAAERRLLQARTMLDGVGYRPGTGDAHGLPLKRLDSEYPQFRWRAARHWSPQLQTATKRPPTTFTSVGDREHAAYFHP